MNSAGLVGLALAGLVCGRTQFDAMAGPAASPDAAAPARAAEGGRRVEDKGWLNVSFEVPPGWKAVPRPSTMHLFREAPSATSIEMGYYQPRHDAQYDSWGRWTQEKLRRLSAAATVRRRHALVVGGMKALQFEWVEKARGAPTTQILETWIARPFADAPDAGEVFVVMLQGADVPGARAAYARLLESLRFLP